MGSFVDQLFSAIGLPVLRGCLGEDNGAYLTPRGGQRSGPFDVILENHTQQRIENNDGRTLEHELIAKFPKQDGLPFWTGRSLVGLIVTLDGDEWALDLVQSLSESFAVVRLQRRASSEASRPGFRHK
jgi:hypothetical protein